MPFGICKYLFERVQGPNDEIENIHPWHLYVDDVLICLCAGVPCIDIWHRAGTLQGEL